MTSSHLNPPDQLYGLTSIIKSNKINMNVMTLAKYELIPRNFELLNVPVLYIHFQMSSSILCPVHRIIEYFSYALLSHDCLFFIEN